MRDVSDRPPYLRGRENEYDGLVPRATVKLNTVATVVGKLAIAEAKAQGRPTSRTPTPPTPSEEEIGAHLNIPTRSKTLFWSGPPKGPPYQQPATELAKAKDFQVLGDLWTDSRYPDRYSKKPHFWDKASKVLADTTSGVARVVLPKKEEPHPGSVWQKTEFPALKRNQKVTQVVKLNFEDKQEEVIHQAGAFALFFSVFSPRFLLFNLDGFAYFARSSRQFKVKVTVTACRKKFAV